MNNRGWIVVGTAALLLAANGVSGAYMGVYYGAVDPTSNSSVRDLSSFTGYGSADDPLQITYNSNTNSVRFYQAGTTTGGNGSLVSDADAKNGSAWQINDATTDVGTFIFKLCKDNGQTWAGNGPFDVNTYGATILARLKVTAFTNGGAELGIDDAASAPSTQGSTALNAAGAAKEFDRNTAFVSAGLADPAAYHIVRLTVGGAGGANAVAVYVDENPTAVISSTIAVSSGFRSPDGFRWGSFGGTGRVTVSFDYIAFTDSGAFAPEADPTAGSFNAQVNLLVPEPSMLALLMVALLPVVCRPRRR